MRKPVALAAVLLLSLAALFATALAGPLQQGPTEEQMDAILQRTSRLRGLPPTGPITRAFMKRDEMRAYYEQSFFEENPLEDLQNTQQLLELLGYIEPGTNIIDLLLDVLGEEVLGFYNRETKTVYVVSERERWTPNDVITLAHEYAHALQDQHFDIKAGYEARKGNNDQQLAYQALVEGDATLLQSVYALRFLTEAQRVSERGESSGRSSALDTAPLILKRELLFPYDDGATFLITQFLEGSWAAVDAVWRDPPASTEQVLHPEKYRAREAPVPVSMPDLQAYLAGDWQLVEENTLGELDWHILIEQFTDAATAGRAAGGWGGDRYQFLRRGPDGGGLLFASRLAWDTERDASEFFDAYQRAVAARHGASLQVSPGLSNTLPPPNRQFVGGTDSLSHAIALDGAVVSLAISSDRAALSVMAPLRFPDLANE